MRRPELALAGRRVFPDSGLCALPKRQAFAITLLVLVPLPLFALTGLNVPLPGVIQRVAASLVPGIREAFSVGEPEAASSRPAAIELVVGEPRRREPLPARRSRSLPTGPTRVDAKSSVAAKRPRTTVGPRRINVTPPPRVRPIPGAEAAPALSNADAGVLTASTIPSGGASVATSGGNGIGGASENPSNLAPVGRPSDSGSGEIAGTPFPNPPASVEDSGVLVHVPDGPAGTSVAVSAGTSGSSGSQGGALGLGETSASAEVTLPGGTTVEVTASLPVGVDLPILGGGSSSSGGSSGTDSSGSGSSGTGSSGSGSSGSGSSSGLGLGLGIGLGSK
jgi:hypothetical protein